MSSPAASISTLRLVAVFVAGVVVGGVLVGTGTLPFGGPPGDAPADRTPDPDSPPYGVATGTGCVPTADANTGWLHEVASGSSRALTANLTVAHAPGETVNATFGAIGDGVYRFRVDVVDAERAGGEPDCTTGSTVDLGASIPIEYDRVDVVVDGRTVGAVANDGDTTAELRTFAWNATTPATDTVPTETTSGIAPVRPHDPHRGGDAERATRAPA
jgi:hypothetical protein